MEFNLEFIIEVIIINTENFMEIVIGNLINFTIKINVTIIMKIAIDIIIEIIMKSSLNSIHYQNYHNNIHGCRDVWYIDKPYRLSKYWHFSKISILISIRPFLKILILMGTFLKISISISILKQNLTNIWDFPIKDFGGPPPPLKKWQNSLLDFYSQPLWTTPHQMKSEIEVRMTPSEKLQLADC